MSSSGDPGSGPQTSEEGVAPVDVDAARAQQRQALKKSARDMLLSMLVIVGIVAVIVLLVPRPNGNPIRAVEVAPAAQGAELALGFTPAVPQGLPAGWTATSADVRKSADDVTGWHVGYVTSDGHYASIEQASKVSPQWEQILDSGGAPQGVQIIDGTSWEQRYTAVRDVTALIHIGGGHTTMVTSKGGGLQNAVTLARSIPASQR